MKSSIAIVILAAGGSTRMQQPKQLMEIAGKPMLLTAIHAALASEASRTFVVLGANRDKHRKIAAGLAVELIDNPTWEKGIGNSLKAGLTRALEINPHLDALLVMVCDQPLVTASHLNRIIHLYLQTDRPVVASGYADTVGVPALFDKAFFSALLLLDDDQGAKKILAQYSETSLTVSFPGGEIDLDTPEAFGSFTASH